MAKSFRFIGPGTHREKQKTYKPGEVVKSDNDLIAMFGKKFVLESEFSHSNTPEVDRGDDVTGDFTTAAKAELQVFKKGSKWYVFELDGTPVTGGLTKKEVDPTIEAYLDDKNEE